MTGVVALAGVIALENDAETLSNRLQGRGAMFVTLPALCGVVALWSLLRHRFDVARFAAVGAVGAVVLGWGVAQYPDVLVDHATIAQVAGARSTLIGLVIVFVFAAITAVPSMIWLFVLVTSDRWAHDAPSEAVNSAVD